jgi:hypothetical protein
MILCSSRPARPTRSQGSFAFRSSTNVYLFISRAVDPRVVQYLLVTEQNASEFQAMQDRRFGVQLSFGFMFLGLALIMLLAAMWIAINFADRLVLAGTPADGRCATDLIGQSVRSGAGTREEERSCSARSKLQSHDQRSAHAAQRTD